jgi:hypothetical protein
MDEIADLLDQAYTLAEEEGSLTADETEELTDAISVALSLVNQKRGVML